MAVSGPRLWRDPPSAAAPAQVVSDGSLPFLVGSMVGIQPYNIMPAGRPLGGCGIAGILMKVGVEATALRGEDVASCILFGQRGESGPVNCGVFR